MLQHPNTIPIYELSRDNQGHYYFTMKLVEGFTLAELVDLEGGERARTERRLRIPSIRHDPHPGR